MKYIYFNNAATSWPKAPRVGKTVAEKINDLPYHAGRAGFSEIDTSDKCRKLLAELMQVKEWERIIFCPNATHALNIALHGFPWKAGANVVTSVSEHNAILRPLYYLEKCGRVKIHYVDVDSEGRIIPEEWEKAVRKFLPQLSVFTHASNVTGAVNDVPTLCSMAKEYESATLLDVSQTLGFTEVKPKAWGIDMVAFTGHKYLLGPTGTGGLYISNGVNLEPVWVGGTGIHSNLDEMPDVMPIRFEAGTPNDPAFAGLSEALSWNIKNPLDSEELLRKTERLSVELKKAGANVINVSFPRTPVISFTSNVLEAEDIGEILHKGFGIICRTGLHCSPKIHRYLGTLPYGTVRLSLSRFTTNEEIDYCISALSEVFK